MSSQSSAGLQTSSVHTWNPFDGQEADKLGRLNSGAPSAASARHRRRISACSQRIWHERFLYRLGASDYRDRFVLKGATLFTLWTGRLHRPTRDLDLLGAGSSEIEDVVTVCKAICGIPAEDGVIFDVASVHGMRIREDAEYEGVRVQLQADLAGARIPMQIDVGFGDAVEHGGDFVQFPVLLPMEAPLIRAYPKESVVAEKLHAVVVLDMANSRMKDFHDIWFMSQRWSFNLGAIRAAITATFERRKTPLPTELPLALGSVFLASSDKQAQWRAFRHRLGEEAPSIALEAVGAVICDFIGPALLRPAPLPDSAAWNPGGGWIAGKRDAQNNSG